MPILRTIIVFIIIGVGSSGQIRNIESKNNDLILTFDSNITLSCIDWIILAKMQNNSVYAVVGTYIYPNTTYYYQAYIKTIKYDMIRLSIWTSRDMYHITFAAKRLCYNYSLFDDIFVDLSAFFLNSTLLINSTTIHDYAPNKNYLYILLGVVGGLGGLVLLRRRVSKITKAGSKETILYVTPLPEQTALLDVGISDSDPEL